MSRTYRKEKGTCRIYPEGQENNLRIRYNCRCEYCTGVTKNHLETKIQLKEMKNQIKEYYLGV